MRKIKSIRVKTEVNYDNARGGILWTYLKVGCLGRLATGWKVLLDHGGEVWGYELGFVGISTTPKFRPEWLDIEYEDEDEPNNQTDLKTHLFSTEAERTLWNELPDTSSFFPQTNHKRKENNMNNRIAAIGAKQVITVKFISDRSALSNPVFSDKEYAYFTDIPDLTVDDWVIVVVCDIPRAVKVWRTMAIEKAQRDTASKWVLAKIDTEAYAARVKTQEAIAEIENELDAAFQQTQRYQTYQLLAGSNPRIQELLSKLQQLAPELIPGAAPAAVIEAAPVETPSSIQASMLDWRTYNNFSPQIYKILSAHGIETIRQLVAHTREQIAGFEGMGNARMAAIDSFLSRNKLKFK